MVPAPEPVADRREDAQAFDCLTVSTDRHRRAVIPIRRASTVPPDPAAPSEDH
jgi:hypothetical protein